MLEAVNKALFIGAHTDDEFVCAGTLHRLARLGCDVHGLTIAPAAIASDRRGTIRSIDIVYPEWVQSLDRIGVKTEHRYFMGLTPSADLEPHRQSICQYIYDLCEKEKPEVVFSLSPDDENTTHALAGIETERVLRGRVPVAIRCQFPWNYSSGRSNLFIRLARADIDCKREVIRAYKSQAFRYRYEEMLLAQCQVDGLSVKVPHAEKFELIRGVI